MIDYLRLYTDKLQPVLEFNENPLVLLSLQYLPGHEIVGDPAPDGWSFDIFNGLQVDAWDRGIERSLLGTSLLAPNGGLALDLARAVKPTSFTLLTNRRLALVKDVSEPGAQASVEWHCSIDDVALIRRAPRGLLARGRVLAAFRDGSAVHLVAGTVSSKKAKQLVAAFASLRRS